MRATWLLARVTIEAMPLSISRLRLWLVTAAILLAAVVASTYFYGRMRVRRGIKEVRKNLRQDIDALENRLKWANIAGMPLLVTISGVTLAVFKRKRTAAK